MSRTALLLALCLALVAATALATPSVHEFETKKAKIIVTVKHGEDEPAESAAPAAASEAAEESSDEGADEESSETGAGASTKVLDRFVLPPEPAAAKGYKSVSACDEDPCDKDDDMEFREQQPCTENCEAESVGSSNTATGPVVMSQPVGGKDGFVPVRDTRTSSSDSWVIVPQVDSVAQAQQAQTQDLASNVISSDAAADTKSCECEVCPCPRFQTPEEKKAEKLAQLVEAERNSREKEKSELHEALAKHQANLAKIEAMGRALRWQYTQLRRHHNILRTHIAANKAAYDELGGDDEYKGTDYDIEARPPPLYESIDDIPALGSQKLDPKVVNKVTQEVQRAQTQEKAILKNLHKEQAENIKALVGDA